MCPLSRLGIDRRAVWFALLASLAAARGLGPARCLAQQPGVAVPEGAAATAPAGPATAAPIPVLPDEVQIVHFEGPKGFKLEVLGPTPEPVPVSDTGGLGTFGFRVGIAYRLRLTNPPERPGAELYPIVELVGHLHRPTDIDPSRFPIRVTFTEDDFVDVVDQKRLVTQIVYLEDPETALPISLPKNEIPVVTLHPAEEPLRVASALGRVMVIVRTGNRKPSVDELTRANGGESMCPASTAHCPFVGRGSSRCALTCGPGRGTPPPPGRPWLPCDEYLCDGGDRAEPLHFGGDGALSGLDPRDALIEFNDGRRPRILPTNIVCIYAPRFAEVRVSSGPNEALTVQAPVRTRTVERQALESARAGPSRLVQNQAAEANRYRARASALRGRVLAGEAAELRVLSGMDNATNIAGLVQAQHVELRINRRKAVGIQTPARAVQIKTAGSAVVTGIVEGAGETVMAWPARETVGVELPPQRPGLAVIKRVSTGEAEPGEIVTFAIQYRNMGNTPIRAASVFDSLIPRLAYVPGSAMGPAGTVFTAAENRAGSTELRWDLPGAIPPGAEGNVSFQVKVR